MTKSLNQESNNLNQNEFQECNVSQMREDPDEARTAST